VRRIAVSWQRTVPAIAAFSILAGGAMLAYGTFVERHYLRDRRVDIPVAGLPKVFDGYHIVQLSDFHAGGRSWSAGTMTRAVAMAVAKNADLIVLTGDYVETTVAIAPLMKILAPLRARDGVLAVLGNHDYTDRSIRVNAIINGLRDNGVRVLRNEVHALRRRDDELWIVGVDDGYSGHDYLPGAFAGLPRGVSPVVLSHYPDLAWKLAPGRFVVVLSGHAHGSQIYLPFLARYARERVAMTRFSHGVYRVNRTPVFVTTGVGTSGRPFRILARPEVASIVLRAMPANGKT